MIALPIKDDTKRYKPEDWENDPLETTRSPERDKNVQELKFHFMKDTNMTTKPVNMSGAEWKTYQKWLLTAGE